MLRRLLPKGLRLGVLSGALGVVPSIDVREGSCKSVHRWSHGGTQQQQFVFRAWGWYHPAAAPPSPPPSQEERASVTQSLAEPPSAARSTAAGVHSDSATMKWQRQAMTAGAQWTSQSELSQKTVLCAHTHVYLSVCLSIYLPILIYLSIHLSIYLLC